MSKNNTITEIEKRGGHFAMTNRHRHPSVLEFIASKIGRKNVFDTDKISGLLDNALQFVSQLGEKKQTILFISSRQETLDILKDSIQTTKQPYMFNRWIGGTLSNFKNVKKRVDRMKKMRSDKDDGGWVKNTKKEKVLLNRELSKLENKFLGISDMDKLPDAIFILDTKKESIAVEEAKTMGIPIIGFSNANANIKNIDYPIIANINSRETVEYIISLITEKLK